MSPGKNREGDPASAADNSSTESRRRIVRPHLRIAVVFLLLVLALGFLLVEGLGSSLDYFDTVSQALAHKQSLGTRSTRLEGTVGAGTVERTSVGANFELKSGNHAVMVQNTGSPPQLFAAGIPVVVVGHFVSVTSDVFVSDQILVKHSASYVAAHPTRLTPSGRAKK